MRFRPRRRDGPDDPEGSRLVDEVADFLQGSVSSIFENDEAPPSWARLNALAHGDAELLGRLASCSSIALRRGEERSWDHTVSYLAAKILLTCTGTGVCLLDLQRRALIPLELELGDHPIGPSTLVRLVLTALQQTSVSGG